MPGNNPSEAEGMPPHARLIKMGTSYFVSRFVFVAARLGLTDHLADGPKIAGDWAWRAFTSNASFRRSHR